MSRSPTRARFGPSGPVKSIEPRLRRGSFAYLCALLGLGSLPSCVVLSDFDGLAGGVRAGSDSGSQADAANEKPEADATEEPTDGDADVVVDVVDEDSFVSTPGVPVLVAGMSSGHVWALVADGGEVYWTVDELVTDAGTLASGVFKASQGCHGGDCGTMIAYAPDSTKLTDIALDVDWLYYGEIDTGRIKRVHRDHGEIQVIAEGQSEPFGISVAPSYVYWTGYEALGKGYIRRTLKAPITPDAGGPAATTMVSDLDRPGFLASDPFLGRLYWASDVGMKIQSCYPTEEDGGVPVCINVRTHSAGTYPDSEPGFKRQIYKVAVEATHVYWREGEMENGQYTKGAVRRVEKLASQLPDGGSPSEILAEGDVAVHPRWLSLDSSYVYWTVGSDGWVYRTTMEPGGPVETLNKANLPTVHSVVAVDGAVFVSTFTPGAIYRIAL